MAIERHLILQELILRPSSEWTPSEERGWVVARVAEGVGYWLPGGSARELNAGDGFVAGFNAHTIVRASQLGPLKLQFFTVQPQYLSGLLTMAEWHQLESASENPLTRVSIFTASEPFGQKFARIAAQTHTDGLTMRCALLQLWTGAVVNVIGPLAASAGGNKLRERFRQLVGQMPEARLSECSLSGLAAQLHCSERHFSRLFREEFGVTFRARQAELRLQHARQLLASSDAKIINVAYDSGYRHLGLFNSMFKKRFGTTPSEWRQQNLRKSPSPQLRKNLLKTVARAGNLLALLMLILNFILPAVTQMNSKTANQGPLPAMTFLRRHVLCLLLFLFCWGSGVVPKLPAAELAASSNPPASAPAAAGSNAASRFNVRAYAVNSNTLLPTNILTGIFSKYTGTNISLDEIAEAASDLQLEYRNQGYAAMCIAIAPQQITNGTVTLNVFPSASPQIWVSGSRYVSSGDQAQVGSNLPAAEPAVPQTAPATIAFATNAVPPASRHQTEAAGPEALALARAALFKKLAELKEQEKTPRVHVVPVSTNGPCFSVDKYQVMGNSILSPGIIGGVLTNVPAAFGTNVTFDAIRAALGDLQMAYRERGYVTVSVGLPPQKLTNASVKVKVTEGRLAAINVTGNHYFSSNNVMCALPDLHTNMLLNSHVFQRELDVANASRDRQIYPVIGPGPVPDTSELTLKVKDCLPLHARVELNNQATPATPDLRANLSAQYDNLWDLEHQIGIQYSFTPDQFKNSNPYYVTPLDDPLIANYSAYYRLPLGGYESVGQQVDANPGSFGYNEITHQFQMPPPTGRPELTLYASRSASDTGVQFGASNIVYAGATPGGNPTNKTALGRRSTGENVTLNEGLGFKLSLPLPAVDKLVSTLTLGADFKRYRGRSANIDLLYALDSLTNNDSAYKFGDVLFTLQSNRLTAVDYLPLNVGLNGSVPDDQGTTFFNAQANFNLPNIFPNDKNANFSNASYTTNARAAYVTLQAGANRIQTIYKDWTVKLHADGQWADGALFSNEQYAMGGTAGVRGYQDGQAYGDTGWRFSIEPQTPLFNLGMIGNEGHQETCWVRASVFLDYGRIYLLEQPPPGGSGHQSFCGAGWAMTANIGSHVDGRLTVGWPLIGHEGESGSMHFYFGIGAQF
jgi:hemolysin activation/secretion protein/AraC-like DNA-binding protein